jgi:hypothetical protein
VGSEANEELSGQTAAQNGASRSRGSESRPKQAIRIQCKSFDQIRAKCGIECNFELRGKILASQKGIIKNIFP